MANIQTARRQPWKSPLDGRIMVKFLFIIYIFAYSRVHPPVVRRSHNRQGYPTASGSNLDAIHQDRLHGHDLHAADCGHAKAENKKGRNGDE
jgi:hypothetical protein